MPCTVPEILLALPTLSKADLEKIKLRASLLIGSTPATPTADQELWLCTGFMHELKRRGLGAFMVAGLPAERVRFIQDYLLQGFGDTQTKQVERLALAELAANALANYLAKGKVPISAKTLYANIDKVPQALEASFPGYWNARAFWVCLQTAKEA